MCGIVGYIGAKDALNVLLEGLNRLEYRGYDSAGVAVVAKDGVKAEKAKGRLSFLCEKVKGREDLRGSAGIGHTRWATHGAPSDENSHPHAHGRVTLVHNGIIENYDELKKDLLAKGNVFRSETDTEVAAHLIDGYFRGEPLPALRQALGMIRGSYALAVLFEGLPDEIWAVRKDSPLIVGIGEGENFLASDIPAILPYTRRYLLPEEGEVIRVTRDSVTVYSPDGRDVTAEKKIMTADFDMQSAEKGGHPHFMHKEIYEQPDSLRRAIEPRIREGAGGIFREELPDTAGIGTIHLVACGSAMHAGLLGKCAIESLARIPVRVEIASEFRYADPILGKNDAVFVISQSGETADSLAALRLAKEKGVRTYAIVNVVGSSIAREADHAIYLSCGPEIAVATTKAYTAQTAVLQMLAVRLAYDRGLLDKEREDALIGALRDLPSLAAQVIGRFGEIEKIAARRQDHPSSFFIGRGQDYAVCCEGSLKLKEISYIHSEAYAAGELKHGTISLITPGVPCAVVATTEALASKTVGNAKEIKARGANVLLLLREDLTVPEDVCDVCFRLPKTEEMLMPILAIIPLQYYAYCVAVGRGCDVDKPRNLAKSVTVE